MEKMRMLTPLFVFFTLIATVAWSGGQPAYNYISAAELEERLRAEENLILLDIQVEEEFGKHHIKGAVPTYAYPAKSEADKEKLDSTLENLRASDAPVVVICPGGGGGATRTVDHLVARGIDPRRLLILAKGQGGWRCADLTESK